MSTEIRATLRLAYRADEAVCVNRLADQVAALVTTVRRPSPKPGAWWPPFANSAAMPAASIT